jgi:hypothetical protein
MLVYRMVQAMTHLVRWFLPYNHGNFPVRKVLLEGKQKSLESLGPQPWKWWCWVCVCLCCCFYLGLPPMQMKICSLVPCSTYSYMCIYMCFVKPNYLFANIWSLMPSWICSWFMIFDFPISYILRLYSTGWEIYVTYMHNGLQTCHLYITDSHVW